ncbi:MAG: L-aspartate oxidase [Thermodesulfovibrio sp. RBG_19FT_COMBO_42_12]|nr:MAG: L-aspartate oxidase [Thermodesulfovibrio sp. RBG_19FT_COMBO_42_12]
MKKEIVDFLIIGSGIAGLRAAIELAPHGKVLVVTKDRPAESSTEYAQGGIAVALSDEDEVGIHFEDTLKAGDGLCSEDAVKILVGEGPERILELISWGAEFDKEGIKLDFTMEAAHSRKRILHAHGDSTGKELERVLLKKVRSFPSVKKYPFAFTKDLIVRDRECHGAYIVREKEITALFAKTTILATGGAGQIFSRTTNPAVATGDGIAIAYRAGAILEDMEFVQFHPTVLFAPSAPQFLLSEAMRGEGAILRNINNELFMKNYHPDAELAPRDVVSRAIRSQMVRTSSNHVYLDLTHLNAEFIKRRFPRIYTTCLQYNVDITKEFIPVSPAAHYIMGGVKTDTEGATSVKGLYAAGEVACTGVHGANRLASNSLLEGLVFGARAGRAALKYSSEVRKGRSLKIKSFILPAELPNLRTSELEEIRTTLRRLMWDRVGIIRCEESLHEAGDKLERWLFILNKTFLIRRELELKNMLTVSKLTTEAAILRKGSVGAHYRSDFPQRGEGWQRHITFKKEDK